MKLIRFHFLRFQKYNFGKRGILLVSLVLLILAILLVSYLCTIPVQRTGERQYLYIDNDDNLDSLYHKTELMAGEVPFMFYVLTDYSSFTLKSGKYVVDPNTNALELYRRLRNGQQIPVRVLVPSVWTVEKMAGRVSKQLMMDSVELMDCLTDSTTLAELGCTLEELPAYFIPNTYEVWWNCSPLDFVRRMKREYGKFWSEKRLAKAEAQGLSPVEVSTLASIVCRETNNAFEMPVIARLYCNRMKKGMLLQACPTVIFARKDFTITRLTQPMEPDSPYNTYRYLGLPPGPIYIAPIQAIDAVLNMPTHNYIYMCAKEDFSGVHRFASTYAEHQRNAAKYQRAYKKRFPVKK